MTSQALKVNSGDQVTIDTAINSPSDPLQDVHLGSTVSLGQPAAQPVQPTTRHPHNQYADIASWDEIWPGEDQYEGTTGYHQTGVNQYAGITSWDEVWPGEDPYDGNSSSTQLVAVSTMTENVITTQLQQGLEKYNTAANTIIPLLGILESGAV